MLFSTPSKDRYCRFTFNPDTGAHERDWIEYADGTFEPVRRNGNLRQKWDGYSTRYQWWHTRKPADWMPWEHGHPFAWNHDLNQGDKPADWGTKSRAEAEAGNAPYFMEVEQAADGRIESRTERIDGRRETWDFQYDEDGRLTAVLADTNWAQDYEYDEMGRRRADHNSARTPLSRAFKYDEADRLLLTGNVCYEHDINGFRCTKIDGDAVTRYQYAEDYRLLGALLPDGRVVSYKHDEDDQRAIKLVDGQPVEAYAWRDFIRLGAFFDGQREYVFNYEDGERLPHSMTVNEGEYGLEYDQVGTLKAVVSPTGNVVKAIQYDVFGNQLWDSNPGLRIPLGFAGGLHDPDTGFVRFGWRDYDPDTGRWTAPDPIGDAGGDEDWYGYCLDDPVNTYDPQGLKGKTVDGVTYDENGMPIDEIGLADPDIDPVMDLIPAPPIGKAINKAGKGTYRIYKTGKEFKFGKNWRIAPLGNRTGKKVGELPHYHRRGVDPKTGKTKDGQGIGRHRPWENKKSDKSYKDRF